MTLAQITRTRNFCLSSVTLFLDIYGKPHCVLHVMFQRWKYVHIFIFFCLFNSSLCIVVQKGDQQNVYDRFQKVFASVGVLNGTPRSEGDISEMLDALFSFIKWIVAMVGNLRKPSSVQRQFGDEPWTEWSQCTKSCGGGVQQRTRGCLREFDFPAQENKDGKEQLSRLLSNLMDDMKRQTCIVTERECHIQPCAIQRWSQWGEWGECYQQRLRLCSNPGSCQGSEELKRPCNQAHNACWSEWEEWSPCSVTCGPNGSQNRIRFDLGCSKDDIDQESRTCLPQPPPCLDVMRLRADTWSRWSLCSRSCDGGLQTRRRSCGGKRIANCSEEAVETRSCGSQPCSSWSSWIWMSPCSGDCGYGTRQRARMCLGDGCVGASHETVRCYNGAC